MATVYTETFSIAGLIGYAVANGNHEVLEAVFPNMDREEVMNLMHNPELVTTEVVEVDIKRN